MNKLNLLIRSTSRCAFNYSIHRQLQLTAFRCESHLAFLRKKTGLAFKLCKQALEQNGNDLSKAEKWLKEEAAKNGWAKSVRADNRKATQGLIGVYINADKSSAVALEVNCETDFVAKNTIFRQLVANITKQIAEATPIHANEANVNKSIVTYSIDPQQLDAFQDAVGEAVAQLGEKIRLNRALIIRNQQDNGKSVRLVGYTHSSSGSNVNEQGVLLGRYATIGAFERLFTEQDYQKILEQPAQVDEEGYEVERPVSFEECTNNICQHIIGMKPKTIGELQAAEPEVTEQSESNEKQATKPDEETDKLLDQQYLLDDDKTVRQYIAFNHINVLDFVRLECGDQSDQD